MITFIIGLLILFFGYIFYSRYVESQFMPDNRKTPAVTLCDNVDFVRMSKRRNMLIQFLNIAGMGPIIGAIQGILFGPVAFILIPVGCILAGGVHDYFCGMISMRNNGDQLTGLIKKYLGNNLFIISIIVISVALLLASAVFVYTSGDLIAENFFHQTDFTLNNPIVVFIYITIALYYILATMFPIDKIIGKFYPIFSLLLLIGTFLIFVGFCIKGINLTNLNFKNINIHPSNLPLIPMFFMTVSCGLLSGFHGTQSTIISRTLGSEYDGKHVFYGMMCLECLIAMIWAAGAMDIYSSNLITDPDQIGTMHVVTVITDKFVPHILSFLVTLAVVVLPITSGDTALRGLRMIISESIHLEQKKMRNRLFVSSFIVIGLFSILYFAKNQAESFALVWRYFTFVNQLIAIPTFIYATIFLYKQGKNYFITLIPGLFYIFITSTFILNNNIGFNLDIDVSRIYGALITLISTFLIIKTYKEK